MLAPVEGPVPATRAKMKKKVSWAQEPPRAVQGCVACFRCDGDCDNGGDDGESDRICSCIGSSSSLAAEADLAQPSDPMSRADFEDWLTYCESTRTPSQLLGQCPSGRQWVCYQSPSRTLRPARWSFLLPLPPPLLRRPGAHS